MASFEKRGTLWSVRYRDTAGRPRRQSGFRTKQEARNWIADREKAQRDGFILDSDQTFGQFADGYLEHHKASPERLQALKYLLAHAKREFEDVPLCDMADKGAAIAIWRAGMSEGTAHDAHTALRQCLAQAVKWKKLTHNAALDTKNPQPERREVMPFGGWDDIDELEAGIAKVDHHYAGLATIITGLGLRPQEWPKLRIEHIDMRARVAALPKSVVKSGTPPRRIPIRKRVFEVLEAHCAGRQSGLVFTTRYGQAVDIRNFRKRVWYPAQELVNEERAEACLPVHPQRKPYDTRHTYATWFLRAGLPTFTLARRMGTSLEMIEKTYGHLAVDSEDHELFVMDAFDGVDAMPTTTERGQGHIGHQVGTPAANRGD